jgi:hypothetical protein
LTRRLAVAVSGVVLLVSCGASGGDSDLRTVADAIREVETKGAAFTFSETLTQTGGDIPKGKMAQIKFSATGQERDDNAILVLRLSNSSGQEAGAYDLMISDSDLYVRPHGSTRQWFEGSASVANHFYPGVRLNLLRETVLLATNASKSTSYNNGSFSDQYTITPGSDQLEQLQSTVVGAAQEAKFLKSATGAITVYLSTSGHHLQRVDFKVSGTDPQTSLKQVFTSTLSFSKLGKVAMPKVPAAAIAVQPSDLFSTADTPPGQA